MNSENKKYINKYHKYKCKYLFAKNYNHKYNINVLFSCSYPTNDSTYFTCRNDIIQKINLLYNTDQDNNINVNINADFVDVLNFVNEQNKPYKYNNSTLNIKMCFPNKTLYDYLKNTNNVYDIIILASCDTFISVMTNDKKNFFPKNYVYLKSFIIALKETYEKINDNGYIFLIYYNNINQEFIDANDYFVCNKHFYFHFVCTKIFNLYFDKIEIGIYKKKQKKITDNIQLKDIIQIYNSILKSFKYIVNNIKYNNRISIIQLANAYNTSKNQKLKNKILSYLIESTKKILYHHNIVTNNLYNDGTIALSLLDSFVYVDTILYIQ